jgi:hypothetical protein
MGLPPSNPNRMILFPLRLHRKIETALGIEKHCLRDVVKQMQQQGMSTEEIYQVVKGGLEWSHLYAPGIPFPVVLQTYISCISS